MISVLWLIIFVAFIVWYYIKVGRKAYYLRNIPGVPTFPIIGNLNRLMTGLKLYEDHSSRLLTIFDGLCNKVFHKEKIFVLWLGWSPLIILFNPEYVEEVLSSNVVIEKSFSYDYLHSWLGTGIFTSTGTNWQYRRKLLTPTFHLRILEDFIPLINEHSMILVENLAKNMKCEDITHYVTLCTLDIICDTTMGVKIDAQNKPDSDYVKSLHFISEVLIFRNVNVLGWFDFIFYRTSYGKEYLKQLKILHEFTRNVIKERKQEFISNKSNENVVRNDKDLVFGRKKRLAFLDLLIEQSLNNLLTDEDIREEVDTVVFAGHDTTAANITWFFYLIGLYPSIQQKLHAELDNVFGDDKTRHITNDDLKQLKYLECCIKESLRLFPSAPLFGRSVKEDLKLKNLIIPKGSSLMVFPLGLHKNSKYFPQPEVFNPERFLPENMCGLHPYAYIPFSAGPRNCIGQRFAMIEEKIVIANVLRNFVLRSVDQRDKICYAFEIILRPKVPIRIICTSR